MKIITKRQAEKIHLESLFETGGTVNKIRYDLGKYDASEPVLGKEIDAPWGVVCIWAEKRKDHYVLWCYMRPKVKV